MSVVAFIRVLAARKAAWWGVTDRFADCSSRPPAGRKPAACPPQRSLYQRRLVYLPSAASSSSSCLSLLLLQAPLIAVSVYRFADCSSRPPAGRKPAACPPQRSLYQRRLVYLPSAASSSSSCLSLLLLQAPLIAVSVYKARAAEAAGNREATGDGEAAWARSRCSCALSSAASM